MLTVSIVSVLVSPVWSDPEAIHVAPIYADSGDIAELPSVLKTTKTVFGFLDFITTVSNTVMVFTSQGGRVKGVQKNTFENKNDRRTLQIP